MSETAQTPPYKIRILLHGLLLAAFKKDRNKKDVALEVGVLHKPVRGHTRALTVVNLDTDETTNIPIEDSSLITLEGLTEELSINSQDNAENLWYWALDYEKIHGNTKLKKIKEKIKPRFTIKNGEVKTLIRSPRLSYQKNNSTHYLAGLAHVVAVDISYATNQSPILKISNHPEPIPLAGGHYNIVLRYDCPDNTCNTHSPLDVNELNDAFYASHIYLMHTLDPNDVEAYINSEVKRVLEYYPKGLNGLDDIYYDYSRKLPPPAARVNPCGMGFFGQSDGLDDSA